MLHPRTDVDAYANSWPREVDTRPGNLGDWPAPLMPPRSGQGRHRRRQRGRHRARGRDHAADLTAERATDLTADRTDDVAAAVAAGAVTDVAGDRAATHTLGPFALPPGSVPPVDPWPAERTPGEAAALGTPPETPVEQTRPAGWWRVPGDAEPRHPRARPPAARAGVEPAPVAERDRRPWLAGTALFVAVAIAGSWVVSSRQHSSDELPPPDTRAYGATGRLPDDTHATHAAAGEGGAARAGGGLSRTGGEATLAATTGAPGVAAVGDPRIPEAMARVYRSAEARLAATAPGCGLSWSLLAGIGKVESDHARGGNIDAEGTTSAPILGPALDGTSGNAAIPDTDRGALDGDTRWDRAVGPSQFIPTSWDIYGADGNDDGRTDPNNAYDAATATGRYLCAGGLDLSDPADLNTAVFRYNHSQDYVDTVLGWARTYASGPGAAAPPVAAPKPATVIPVPPRAAPPPRAGVAAPATSVPTAREPRRPASSPAASSSAPAPRTRVPRHQAPRSARPHATPSRPTRSAAPPVRPAPAPTTAPDTTRPMPTDQAPTRRPAPRTTPAPTTTTTTPPPTTTPASPPGSPSTDPRSPGCLLQATTPTSTPAPASGLPYLPGTALLGDLAGSITLLGDCCNDW